MNENLKIWNNIKRPPVSALQKIKAGRLKGMSDINPQWRLEALTNQFGPCGVGWKYEIAKAWTDDGSEGITVVNVEIKLYIKHDGAWSDPIPGMGGSQLIKKESAGMYTNDEAYKMALTDALSVAGKALGLASDIYMGLWDGSKYLTAEKALKVNFDKAVAEKLGHTPSQDEKTVVSDSIKALAERKKITHSQCELRACESQALFDAFWKEHLRISGGIK